VNRASKYYKQKMVVIDVCDGGQRAVCRIDDGRTVTDMHANDLETVIPKMGPGAAVRLVVDGGVLAKIVQMDKNKQTAVVRMLDDEDDTRIVHFDEICEYAQV